MNLDQLAQHLKIAELAIAHHVAQNATREAKTVYHTCWQLLEAEEAGLSAEDVERGGIWPEYRIKQGHARFDYACFITQPEHEAYKAAKRAEYNAKRRLESAIRGLK